MIPLPNGNKNMQWTKRDKRFITARLWSCCGTVAAPLRRCCSAAFEAAEAVGSEQQQSPHWSHLQKKSKTKKKALKVTRGGHCRMNVFLLLGISKEVLTLRAGYTHTAHHRCIYSHWIFFLASDRKCAHYLTTSPRDNFIQLTFQILFGFPPIMTQ